MEFIKTFWKQNYYLIILILISAATYLPWIIGGKYITFGDASVYLPNSQRDLITNALSVYTSNTNLGAVQIMASYNPILFVYGLLSRIHIGYDYALRLLLLWPYIILTPVYAYKLSQKILSDKKAAFVASLVIMLNTCTLMLVRGGLLVFFADTLLIIFFYYAWIFINEKHEAKNLLKLFLVGLLLAAYEFRIFYIAIFISTFYLLYKMYINHISVHSKKRILGLWFGVLASIGLCNLFWILPLKNLGAIQNNSLFSRGLFGDEFFDISSALTLFHRFWTGGLVIPFVVQPIPYYFWLIPILVAVGLMTNNKRNKDLFFFSTLALIGILLTKQVGAPFNSLYQWLYDHFPGFNAFREASKFYILTIIGYAIIIGSIFTKQNVIKPIDKKIKIILKIVFVGICGLFLFNAVPFVNRSFGVLLIPKSIPNEYNDLNAFLDKQSSFFRTYWISGVSRWGSYDNNKPAISGSEVAKDNWSNLFDSETLRPDSIKPIANFDEPYSAKLFSMAGVKYVVLPSRDIKSNDDFFQELNRNGLQNELDKVNWLKKINLVDKSIAIYQNTNIKPYFSTEKSLVGLNSYVNAEQKLNFIHNSLGLDYVTTNSSNTATNYNVTQPFEQLQSEDVSKNKITFERSLSSNDDIYVKPNANGYSYKVINDSLIFSQNDSPQLNIGSHIIDTAKSSKQVATIALSKNQDYVLIIDGKFITINKDDSNLHNLGNVKNDLSLASALNVNLVQQPAEDGLWQNNVEDCNNYDRNSSIGLTSYFDPIVRTNVNKLIAQKHTACTGPSPVSFSSATNNLLISFKYSLVQGKEIGYRLEYNDPNHTSQNYYLSVTDSSWRTENRIASIPKGATSARLLMLATPNEQNPIKTITNYYDARISVASKDDSLSRVITNNYTAYRVGNNVGKLNVVNNSSNTTNLVHDPSFESGLWQRKVSDCHNYDNSPQISMKSLNNIGTQGTHALQLKASRHIACTSPQSIAVSEGQDYKLNFEYQNQSQSSARYTLTFNDPNKTVVNQELTYSHNKWHTESSFIQAPEGATTLNLTIYTTPDETAKTTSIDWFDNFRLTRLPISPSALYLVHTNKINFSKPKNITYVSKSPTEKNVAITSATGNIFLTMSEAYDKNWLLSTSGSKSDHSGIQHISVNDFENGWIINVKSLCSVNITACNKNADGSYNLKLVAEFTPQRYFYVGLIVSGVTLAGCLGYLGYSFVRSRRKRSGDVYHDPTVPVDRPSMGQLKKEMRMRVKK